MVGMTGFEPETERPRAKTAPFSMQQPQEALQDDAQRSSAVASLCQTARGVFVFADSFFIQFIQI